MPYRTRKRVYRPRRKTVRRKKRVYKRKRATLSKRTKRVQDASYVAKTKLLTFEFVKDFAITPDATGVKTFNRFQIDLNYPGQPLTGVYPVEAAADGWKAHTGSMADSTPFIEDWIHETGASAAAERGKYRQAVVISSDVTLTAIPFGSVFSGAPAVQTRSYESLVTMSKSTMPASEFYAGLGSDVLYDSGATGTNGQNMARMPFTKQGVTRVAEGAVPKPVRMTLHYNRKAMNAIQPLDHFTFDPGSVPLERDYAHVSLVPINPSKTLAPVPHRFTIKVRYLVKLAEPGSLQQEGGLPVR